MCFSAEASFVASAGLAVAGVATLKQAAETSRSPDAATPLTTAWPLAAVPLLFALHQASEGMLWLNLGEDVEALWSHVFAILAYCGWPIYLPLALWLYESDPVRRRYLAGLAVLGFCVACYFLYFMLDDGMRVRVTHHNLRYSFDYPAVVPTHIAYGVAVMVGPALARSWALKAFAAGLWGAYGVAYVSWGITHPSVWCYFAGVLSLLLFVHFRWVAPRLVVARAGPG
jgi:hypothetical protein